MKKTIYYSQESSATGATEKLDPVTPFAHIDLTSIGSNVYTVKLVLNVPQGSLLDTDNLEISEIMETECGCNYRVCSMGITLGHGSNVYTGIPVPIQASLLEGAALLMIEIIDTNNPTTRPRGRTVIVLPGGITIVV